MFLGSLVVLEAIGPARQKKKWQKKFSQVISGTKFKRSGTYTKRKYAYLFNLNGLLSLELKQFLHDPLQHAKRDCKNRPKSVKCCARYFGDLIIIIYLPLKYNTD